MIIHHMSNGTIRESIDGVIVPRKFEKIYEMANKRKVKVNGNKDTTRTIKRK